MSQTSFSPEWIDRFTDPYATLGLSVAADDRRVLKRYRQIAKLLHPDTQIGNDQSTQEFANQVLTRLVNPAYQRLKSDKERSELLATQRFRVRRLCREDKLHPQSTVAKTLLNIPETEVEIYYEQVITELASNQYESPQHFNAQTEQMGELNLIYLRRKMGDLVIREKRTGLVAAPKIGDVSLKPIDMVPKPLVNYAERHVDRAKEYIKKGNAQMAIQELRDAIRLDPKNSNYHAMLGQVYLRQNLNGMAKTYFRQALKLDARNAVARKYAEQLNLSLDQPSVAAKPAEPSRKGLFGLFAKKR